MCGICGIFSRNGQHRPSSDLVRRMTRTLSHRGPDSGSVIEAGFSVVGHRRLAVIDPAKGMQPLRSSDNRYVLSYNGELYNHEDLRKELKKLGHNFESRCDTEVVLNSYIEWREKCIEKFNGMFAFAVFDTVENILFLARDRLGQKPLFYAECGNDIAFASELSTLSLHPQFNHGIDMTSLHIYISNMYIPAPDTIYACAKELPPAHYAIITRDNISLKKYWSVDFSKKVDMSFDEAKNELKNQILSATEKRLMSDVPLGAFLSGGLDSSITVAAMSEVSKSSIRTFTIGSHDNRYNEIAYANSLANRFKTSHYTRIAAADSTANLEGLLEKCGQPFADSSILPTYQISCFAKEHVTVALSGDGADEIFGGYDRYVALWLASKTDLLPDKIRKVLAENLAAILPENTNERSFLSRSKRFLESLGFKGLQRYTNMVYRWSEPELKRLYSPALWEVAKVTPQESIFKSFYDRLTSESSIERILELDLSSYLPGDVLTKVDRASMATSLEVRSPFLDHNIVEFAASLPIEWKLNGFNRKHILCEAFKELIPEEILFRRKMGFGIPVGEWLRGDYYETARDILLSETARAHGFFNTKNIENLLTLHYTRKIDATYQLWTLLCFELWFKSQSI